MHAMLSSDTVSYPFGHGKPMALKILKSADHSGLYTVFGEQSANHQQLLETGRKFICSPYGVAAGKSMASARYALYTKRTRWKAACVKTLRPSDANLSCHILRAHYQVMLCKAAEQQPAWTSSTASAKLSGKLAAVMHVAVIQTDCFAHHTVLCW